MVSLFELKVPVPESKSDSSSKFKFPSKYKVSFKSSPLKNTFVSTLELKVSKVEMFPLGTNFNWANSLELVILISEFRIAFSLIFTFKLRLNIG